jgi:predicted membrane protein
MKKLWVVVGMMVLSVCQVMAQDYKVSKSTGKLDVKDLNNVEFEGTTGNEIIFTSRNGKRDKDERAIGLKAVSAMGLEDNTGMGLSVVEKGDVIEVRQLKKMDGPDVKILVPKGVSISLSHSSPHGSDIKFTNVEGEIEVSTVHNGVYLDNTTGPLTINTVHGEIEAKLPANFKNPISLLSVHGAVDLALPTTTKATMKMTTVYGEIFVDPDFKLAVETKGDLVKYSSNTVNGKINGGGLDITLSSTHGSVYLRKK